MRIISDFKDYYDFPQKYGFDPKIQYLRKSRFFHFGRNKQGWTENINPTDKNRWLLTSISRSYFPDPDSRTIGFCGKLYEFFIYKDGDGVKIFKTKDEALEWGAKILKVDLKKRKKNRRRRWWGLNGKEPDLMKHRKKFGMQFAWLSKNLEVPPYLFVTVVGTQAFREGPPPSRFWILNFIRSFRKPSFGFGIYHCGLRHVAVAGGGKPEHEESEENWIKEVQVSVIHEIIHYWQDINGTLSYSHACEEEAESKAYEIHSLIGDAVV